MKRLRPFNCALRAAYVASVVVIAAHAAVLTCAERATWTEHDTLVRLRNLPQQYSCAELYSRFHDILLKVGAGPDMRILAYGCDAGIGSRGNSPNVRLHFQLPQLLQETQPGGSGFSAMRSAVQIGPGEPPSLKPSDCDLLRQIREQLLAALPLQVDGERLSCEPTQPPDAGFGLTVQALFYQG